MYSIEIMCIICSRCLCKGCTTSQQAKNNSTGLKKCSGIIIPYLYSHVGSGDLGIGEEEEGGGAGLQMGDVFGGVVIF